MNREYFSVEENDASRKVLAETEQRRRMLRSLLLVFTLIVGENLPVDTHPKAELPTTPLRRPEGLSKSFLSDKMREEIARHASSFGRSDEYE